MTDPKYAERQFYRVVINATIETVWSELIDQTKPRPFFWNGSWDIADFTAGEAYRITANNGQAVAVIGRVLEMDPPHRMVTSFRLTSLPDPASRVIYELADKDGVTEFTMITEHVLIGSKSEKSMAEGAQFIVENFKHYIETGHVKFGARLMLGLMGAMSFITPKAMSAENWPIDKAE